MLFCRHFIFPNFVKYLGLLRSVWDWTSLAKYVSNATFDSFYRPYDVYKIEVFNDNESGMNFLGGNLTYCPTTSTSDLEQCSLQSCF